MVGDMSPSEKDTQVHFEKTKGVVNTEGSL